eukprot:7894790-Pyramimonas_sp.AAC.1
MRGGALAQHMRAPGAKPFRTTDEAVKIRVPVDKIDVTRSSETVPSFVGESNLRELWDGSSAADYRSLSEPWTGLMR